MADAIAGELIKFKDTVSASLGSMRNTVSSLSSKIDSLVSVTSSTQTSISSVYSSSNTSVILDKFNRINVLYNKINDSLQSDLTSILDKSEALIQMVIKLEELKKQIEEQEEAIRNAGDTWSYSYDSNGEITNRSEVDAHNRERQAKIDEANRILAVKRSEFSSLHEEAKSALDALMAMDSSLSFVSTFGSANISNLSDYYTGYIFKKFSFTASNGETLEYLLYKPTYSTNVDKLPVHVYLPGYGETDKDGLASVIMKGFHPNGILLYPITEDGRSTDDSFEDAVIELINNVVVDNNADANRISLSGNSRGAIGGYRLISRYPDYFSAYVPISGHSNKMDRSDAGWDALGNVKIWAIHGTNDESVSYYGATNTYDELKKRGYNNMEIYSWEGAGHGIEEEALSGKYEYGDTGEKINPVIWALNQVKGES